MTEELALRRVFRVVNGGTPTSDEENWSGDVPFVTPADLAFVDGAYLRNTSRSLTRVGADVGSCRVPGGSLLVSTRAPIGYVVETTYEVSFNQGCRALVPLRKIDLRYFRYQLFANRGELISAGQGTTFAELSSDGLASLKIRVPPLCEQHEIADFLDAETARIDALIEKKRRMIALLDERWSSDVRGLLAQLEPVLPLKRRWRVIDCKHRTPEYVPDGYPVVSPGDTTVGRIDLRLCHRFVGEDDFADLTEGRRPCRGDLIYSRNASAGIASYVDTGEPFCMGQDVCLITSAEQNQLYLMYALNSLGADQLQSLKIGSTITRINVDRIGELLLPAPPPDAQRTIALRLDAERRRVDRLGTMLMNQVSLLREHRQTLITAAVTGQLDLSKAAA